MCMCKYTHGQYSSTLAHKTRTHLVNIVPSVTIFPLPTYLPHSPTLSLLNHSVSPSLPPPDTSLLHWNGCDPDVVVLQCRERNTSRRSSRKPGHHTRGWTHTRAIIIFVFVRKSFNHLFRRPVHKTIFHYSTLIHMYLLNKHACIIG